MGQLVNVYVATCAFTVAIAIADRAIRRRAIAAAERERIALEAEEAQECIKRERIAQNRNECWREIVSWKRDEM